MAQTQTHKSEEFRRFEELARKVINTPKADYDKHQAESQKKRKKRPQGKTR